MSLFRATRLGRPAYRQREVLSRSLTCSACLRYAKPADDRELPNVDPAKGNRSRTNVVDRRGVQAASPSSASTGQGTSSNTENGGRDWTPRRTLPLATAQTLTLFSTSPDALLLALRSTLQGMITSLARGASLQGQTGRPLEQIDAQAAAGAGRAYTLLFALSKDLPQQQLGQAVGLLRGDKKIYAEAGIDHVLSESVIRTRLGLLSSPVPASLIPDSVLNPAAPPLAPRSTLHSVALSLLPSTHAVAFRSKIRGKEVTQVGRWPDRKESWNDERGREKVAFAAQQEQENSTSGSGAGRINAPGRTPGGQVAEGGWRALWGKENILSQVPAELEQFYTQDGSPKSSLLSTVLFSDPAPQGLLEGFDARFPHASHAGVLAPATPFETGRDQTIFFQKHASEATTSVDEITHEGAVGIALVGAAPQDGLQQGLKITTRFEGLKELGPRRALTGARGNIISSLEGGNATQQFLRDIQSLSGAKKSTQNAAAAAGFRMDTSEAREISKGLSKEEEFYLGIFEQEEGGVPIVLARILSGAPTRGSLSIDTDIELGVPESAEGKQRFVQFYQTDPTLSEAQFPSALDIPGPNPGDWASPRFLFLTPSTNTVEGEGAVYKEDGQKKKAQVLALPNMFVAASDRGWIQRKAPSSNSTATSTGEQGRITNVPGSSVMLSLVVEDE